MINFLQKQPFPQLVHRFGENPLNLCIMEHSATKISTVKCIIDYEKYAWSVTKRVKNSMTSIRINLKHMPRQFYKIIKLKESELWSVHICGKEVHLLTQEISKTLHACYMIRKLLIAERYWRKQSVLNKGASFVFSCEGKDLLLFVVISAIFIWPT